MIRQFELSHGVVLAKIVRGNPGALRLVETHSDDWSSYKLNDTVSLLVSSRQKPYVARDGSESWQFVFSANQLRQLNSNVTGVEAYAALVCSNKYTCLLGPSELRQLINFARPQDSITVRKPTGNARLQVVVNREVRFRIPANRLDNWVVPGS